MNRHIMDRTLFTGLLGIVCLFFLYLFLSSPLALAGEGSDEQSFLREKAALEERLQKERQALLAEKDRLEKEGQALREEMAEASATLLSRQSLVSHLATFFGLSFVLGGLFSLMVWLFPLTVLNHALYLFLREKVFFHRYKKAILITLGAMLAAWLFPFLAQAQSREAAGSQRGIPSLDLFEEKLKEVNRILGRSPAERQIAMMESARSGQIVLEKIPVKDPYLIPVEGPVDTGTPLFLYTLAALYREVGKEERAQETLRQLNGLPLEQKWFEAYAVIYPRLLEMDIENNDMIEASRIARRLMDMYGRQGNTKALMDFSALLMTRQMTQSANEAIRMAIETVEPGQDALDLTDYLLAMNRISEALSLLHRIILESGDVQSLLPVITFCMEKDLGQETSRAIDKAGELCRVPADDLILSRFLFEKGRKEESARALNAARQRAEDLEDLLTIARMARELGFLSLAIEAIEKAVMTDLEASEHVLQPPLLLGEKTALPTGDPISLATYLGILQELDRRLESAQISYAFSPERSLDRIMETHGQVVEGSLNDFFYLKRFWATQDPDRVSNLLAVYSRLQQKALEKLAREGEQDLSALKEEIGVLRADRDTTLEALASLRSQQKKAAWSIFLYGLRNSTWMVFGGFVLAGCIIAGIRSFRAAPRFKLYAFSWRFQEALGWSLVMSIFALPIGIGLVLWGQFMGLFQSVEQAVQRSATST